jgi:hypothetical protein
LDRVRAAIAEDIPSGEPSTASRRSRELIQQKEKIE